MTADSQRVVKRPPSPPEARSGPVPARSEFPSRRLAGPAEFDPTERLTSDVRSQTITGWRAGMKASLITATEESFFRPRA